MPAPLQDRARDFLSSHTIDEYKEVWDRFRDFVGSRTMGENEAYFMRLLADDEVGKTLSDMDEINLLIFFLLADRIERQPDFLSTTVPPFDNFLRGLKSPDKAQQDRFKALESMLRGTTPSEVAAVLPALERAKKHAGRKQGSEIDDGAVLLKMRTAVIKDGLSIPQAAGKFAGEAKVRNTTASLDSTAKRLRGKYRKKY